MTLLNTFNELDRLSSSLLTAFAGASDSTAVDVYRDANGYVLEADLPGVDPKSIDVTVENGWLTVTADRRYEGDRTDGPWLVHERAASHFARSLAVADDVDVDRISADFADGVLKVVMPLSAEGRGRRVAVSVGGSRQQAVSPGAGSAGALTAGATKEPHGLGARLAHLVPWHRNGSRHRGHIPVRREELATAN